MGDKSSSQDRAETDGLVSFTAMSCTRKGSVFAPRMDKASTQEYLYAMTEVRVSLQTKL